MRNPPNPVSLRVRTPCSLRSGAPPHLASLWRPQPTPPPFLAWPAWQHMRAHRLDSATPPASFYSPCCTSAPHPNLIPAPLSAVLPCATPAMSSRVPQANAVLACLVFRRPSMSCPVRLGILQQPPLHARMSFPALQKEVGAEDGAPRPATPHCATHRAPVRRVWAASRATVLPRPPPQGLAAPREGPSLCSRTLPQAGLACC